jgi:hypothetical protein
MLSKRDVGWLRYVSQAFAHRQTDGHAENIEAHFTILVRRHYLSRYCMGASAKGKGTFWALLSIAGRLATKSP